MLNALAVHPQLHPAITTLRHIGTKDHAREAPQAWTPAVVLLDHPFEAAHSTLITNFVMALEVGNGKPDLLARLRHVDTFIVGRTPGGFQSSPGPFTSFDYTAELAEFHGL